MPAIASRCWTGGGRDGSDTVAHTHNARACANRETLNYFSSSRTFETRPTLDPVTGSLHHAPSFDTYSTRTTTATLVFFFPETYLPTTLTTPANEKTVRD